MITAGPTLYKLGSGWLSALGHGCSAAQPHYSVDTCFNYPELLEYIPELPSRFGRFDVYSKVTFSAAVLALKDAGLLERENRKNIGLVVGSASGVYDNDLSFFATAQDVGGSFASPNLFSYTLPNVALGEIAVFFRFMGPSFCVGNDPAAPGTEALTAAFSMLEANLCTHMLVGWVEVAAGIKGNVKSPKGAAFSMISLDNTKGAKAEWSNYSKLSFQELFEA